MRGRFCNRMLLFLAAIVTCMLMAGGVSALADKTPPAGTQVAADPSNDYLAIQVGSDGRFNSGATGIVTGSSFNISFAWPNSPWSSFTTVRVDGADYIYGNGDGCPLVQPPTDLPDLVNESVAECAGVRITQTLQIVNGTSTGRPDTGMYKYTVSNLDAVPHDVGVRVMVDTMLNSNDGAPFRVPGVGDVTTEMDFTGAAIPDYWQAFYDLTNPDIVAQGTLRGGGATTPDRFALTTWPGINSTTWDYTVTPGNPVTGDSAATVWWNPVALAPGETRDFVTYYGLGTVSGTAALSITGPVNLTNAGSDWSPNPFTVTAYVANNTDAAMTDVPLTLTLPAGLELSPGEVATHTIPSIAPGDTGLTSWSVRAQCTGDWTYSVSGIGLEANRSINVPPLRPILTLSKQSVYWGSYANYVARSLSVAYSVNNLGLVTAYNVMIIDSQASNGVMPEMGSLPVSLGDIAGGSSASYVLKYTVPVDVSSFSTSNSGTAEEACGGGLLYTYP